MKSIELRPRAGLIWSDPARGDLRPEIVLSPYRRPREATERGELADVGERIGDRTLEELLGRAIQWGIRSEIVIQRLDRREEAIHVAVPRLRRRFVPDVLALGVPMRPLEQIAEVGKDLGRRA